MRVELNEVCGLLQDWIKRLLHRKCLEGLYAFQGSCTPQQRTNHFVKSDLQTFGQFQSSSWLDHSIMTHETHDANSRRQESAQKLCFLPQTTNRNASDIISYITVISQLLVSFWACVLQRYPNQRREADPAFCRWNLCPGTVHGSLASLNPNL